MDSRALINVIDNLESTSATDALSANQGKVLNEKIGEDSGWINLTLTNGAVAYNEAQTPQYRKIGKTVYLRGVFKGTANGTYATIATLPEGYRTSMRLIYNLPGSGSQLDRLEIETNGNINFANEGSETTDWKSIAINFMTE